MLVEVKDLEWTVCSSTLQIANPMAGHSFVILIDGNRFDVTYKRIERDDHERYRYLAMRAMLTERGDSIEDCRQRAMRMWNAALESILKPVDSLAENLKL